MVDARYAERRTSRTGVLAPKAVQIEIQFYHIHPRFAQQAERAALRVVGDHAPDGFFVHPTGSGHPGDLVFGGDGFGGIKH
jgi:hypothetical protein